MGLLGCLIWRRVGCISPDVRERQYLAARYRLWWSLVLFTKYCSSPPSVQVVELHFPFPLLGLCLAILFVMKWNVNRVGCAFWGWCLKSTPPLQALRDYRAQPLLIHAGHILWMQNYPEQLVRGALPSQYQLYPGRGGKGRGMQRGGDAFLIEKVT